MVCQINPGVDIVSHLFLVLLTKRERPQFSLLISIKLNAIYMDSTRTARSEFSLKIIWRKKKRYFEIDCSSHEQAHQAFVCESEFFSNQQA